MFFYDFFKKSRKTFFEKSYYLLKNLSILIKKTFLNKLFRYILLLSFHKNDYLKNFGKFLVLFGYKFLFFSFFNFILS